MSHGILGMEQKGRMISRSGGEGSEEWYGEARNEVGSEVHWSLMVECPIFNGGGVKAVAEDSFL
jgi:hypothetical protein